MNILVISTQGDALPLSMKLLAEGHDVSTSIHKSSHLLNGHGLVPRIRAWREGLRKADLVIADSVAWSSLSDTLGSLKMPCIGMDSFWLGVSRSRTNQQELLRKLKIPVLPGTEVIGDDLEVLNTNFPKQPIRIESNDFSVVCKDEAMFEFIQDRLSDQTYWVSNVPREDYYEIRVSCFHNNRTWVGTPWISFEERGVFGVHGRVTTEAVGATNVGITRNSRLFSNVLRKLEIIAARTKYKGVLSITGIMVEDNFQATGVSGEFPWDSFTSLINLYPSWGDMLYDIAIMSPVPHFESMDISAEAKICLPPWPYGDPDESLAGMPVQLPEAHKKFYALRGVHALNGRLEVAGHDPLAMRATSFGRSVSEAHDRLASTIRALDVPYLVRGPNLRRNITDQVAALTEAGWIE